MQPSELKAAFTGACNNSLQAVGVGHVADYIPALARIDPGKFGAAVVTVDNQCVSFGDSQEGFSIQSVSKVFSLSLALRNSCPNIWNRVGREPSGSPFNSIVQLESELGIPRNPFINAGALVVCDLLLAHYTNDHQPGTLPTAETKDQLKSLVQTLAEDDGVSMDTEVAESELAASNRNAGLAHFMASFGNVKSPIDDVLDVYCHQCAIDMSCEQLARAGLFLANRGIDPVTKNLIVGPEQSRRTNALMMLCGHYDASGDFAFRVGIPAKSGVGGGILAIVPGRAAIAVWSPCLNDNGNSHAGTVAMAEITHALGWQSL